jgi:hypothetical protein
MPEFDTSEPISVILEFDVGIARITASERTTTVVEVLPSNGTDENDMRVVQGTSITCSGGTLRVKAPKQRSMFGRSGSIDVSIELPAGSTIEGTSPMADFTCTGPLGNCRFKTSLGDIHITEAATVHLKTDHGDIHVDRATGDADITGAGRIDIGRIAGTATVKNLNGETTISEVGGVLRANSSNGRIRVGLAHAGVDARSANGGIRIDEVARGQVALQTGVGDLEVGIPESTAAWLDVNSRFGTVRNFLGSAEAPQPGDETVEVRARTHVGDIVIRRP